MSVLQLAKRGIRALLSGNFHKIYEWLQEQFLSGLGEPVSSDTPATPSWLVEPENAEIIRYTLDSSARFEGNASDWFTVSPEAETRCAIETEEPFRRLDFSLVNTATSKRLEATVEFETEADETVTRDVSLTNSESDDIGNEVPFSVTIDEDATSATVTADAEYVPESRKLTSYFHPNRTYEPLNDIRLGHPAPRPGGSKPPIFLISLDALQYDVQSELQPLIQALGDDAVVPAEPRIQGHWTAPSHGSMFTGVHPGVHEYVGYGDSISQPIHPGLTTIPELLTENLYKCSARVTNPKILPEFGFGRGFSQYELKKLFRTPKRQNDARDVVNRAIEWIDRDCTQNEQRVFYFLHILDPHSPYLPPLPSGDISDVDIEMVREYCDRTTGSEGGSGKDYLKLLDGEVTVDEETVRQIKDYYSQTVEHTAQQVARLVEHLKREGLFADSFIIITGDHGEEFGERGFYHHNSLYDANIRPFMAIKPPADADWTVPDTVNTIDFLPSIAREIGVSPPEYCQGQAWQEQSAQRDQRITERVHKDWYNVAVERDGVKGIFTYPSGGTHRPTAAQIEDGPVEEEYYRLAAVRDGQYDDCRAELSEERLAQLRSAAESFATTDIQIAHSGNRSGQGDIPDGVEKQLEDLGYR